MIEGVHHINIVVSDLNKAIEFFMNVRFTVFEEKKLSGKWIDEVVGLENVKAAYAFLKIERSSIIVELLQYLHPVGEKCESISLPNTVGICHIALRVSNIQAEVNKLRASGVEFFSGVKTNPYGKKCVILRDPMELFLNWQSFS